MFKDLGRRWFPRLLFRGPEDPPFPRNASELYTLAEAGGNLSLQWHPVSPFWDGSLLEMVKLKEVSDSRWATELSCCYRFCD